MKATQDHQQKYYNHKHKIVEFKVKEFMFKGQTYVVTAKFDHRGKLNPSYIELFEIIERVEKITYHLSLPVDIFDVHNIFHISTLTK